MPITTHSSTDAYKVVQQQRAQTFGNYQDQALPHDADRYRSYGSGPQYQQAQQYTQPTHNDYAEHFSQWLPLA
jgi:hypothetical protein